MTYNVHSCVGMDGKISPQRIARIIGQYEPDIVALQELDIGRSRTGDMDQPHLIARELQMLYHFHPIISVEEEQYGNAVLSRFPMKVVFTQQLPKLNTRFNMESRGAICVSLNIEGRSLLLTNTHLSFYLPECRLQAESLVNHGYLNGLNKDKEVILCGDFNCLPNSQAWRIINDKYKDAQYLLLNHKPMATWFGHYPLGRIDHVFLSSGIKVVSIEVPRTELSKKASDHLPLIVDIDLISQAAG